MLIFQTLNKDTGEATIGSRISTHTKLRQEPPFETRIVVRAPDRISLKKLREWLADELPLDDKTVTAIRDMRRNGATEVDIAALFAVSVLVVQLVCSFHLYWWVPYSAAGRKALRAAHGNMVSAKSVLTADDVREIRRRAAQGEGGSALAREFGVAPSTVSNLVARRTWKDLPDEPRSPASILSTSSGPADDESE